MVKTPITVKLDKSHIDVLKNELGGSTRGIEGLIENYLKNKTDGEPDPEREFFECLYLPSEKNLRATYMGFLNSYVGKGNLPGTLGAYIDTIIGETGYDEPTIRKHFRKLTGSGFIKLLQNMMFRPTLRIRETVTRDRFKIILETYSLFIQGEANFTDYWNDDDDM